MDRRGAAEEPRWVEHLGWGVAVFLFWWLVITGLLVFVMDVLVTVASSGMLSLMSFDGPKPALAGVVAVAVAVVVGFRVYRHLRALTLVDEYHLPPEDVKRLSNMNAEQRSEYVAAHRGAKKRPQRKGRPETS